MNNLTKLFTIFNLKQTLRKAIKTLDQRSIQWHVGLQISTPVLGFAKRHLCLLLCFFMYLYDLKKKRSKLYIDTGLFEIFTIGRNYVCGSKVGTFSKTKVAPYMYSGCQWYPQNRYTNTSRIPLIASAKPWYQCTL